MTHNLSDIVTRHSRMNPDRIALTDGEIALSYKVLESSANRFAQYLIDIGCKPGDRVALFAKKRAILFVGMLAAFKSGAIFAPIDPVAKAEKLEYMISDLSPRIVLVDANLVSTVSGRALAQTVVVPTDLILSYVEQCNADLAAERKPANGLPAINGDDPAYCIYTSGSTGWPKGVVIRHASVIDFFEGAKEFYDVDEASRCASFSPLHVDACVFDVLLPLYQGASIFVYSDFNIPALMLSVLKTHSITHFAAFGIALDLIARAPEFQNSVLPELVTVLTGADVPNTSTVHRWMERNVGVKVVNAYGPTEATCAVAAHIVRIVEPSRLAPYPIGMAFKHAKLFLVRGDTVIDEPETEGELLIGGSQLMKGYWNNEEETAAKQISIKGCLCYRTGDLCKILPDGSMFFLGRADDEVKISGYRVHLSEVRRVISSVEGVEVSEVTVISTSYGERILAAAISLKSKHNSLDNQSVIRNIKNQLSLKLSSHMIPRRIFVLDDFPQLSSGKVDRKAISRWIERQIQLGQQEVTE